MEKKTRKPKQKRSIENKALLLNAAKKLFMGKGYLNTSSNEIVREAGVSIGTFYAYYRDKKEIFMEIIDEYLTEYNKKLEDGLNSIQVHGSRNYIKTIIRETIDINKKYYNFQDELIALRHTDHDIMMQNERSNQYILSKIKEMLERINVMDQDLNISAFLFFCLVDNFSYTILRQADLDVDASIEQCTEMILRYSKLN